MLYLTVEFRPDLKIAEYRIVYAVASCMFSFAASRSVLYKADEARRAKVMRGNVIFMFLVYLFLLINLTLIDPEYRRGPADIFDRSFSQYVSHALNIVPFRTIKLFYNGWRSGLVTDKDAYINLLGNIFAFAPFAFFLPLISKKKMNIIKFAFFMFFIISAVEVSQFLLRTGYCDVDDLILNMSGALFLYLMLHLRFVRTHISSLTLLAY